MEEKDLTGKIINTFYKVYNALGYGFIEIVYHNAMILELTDHGLVVESQSRLPCIMKDESSGHFVWISLPMDW